MLAMCKAGKESEALRMLEQLATNATKERRYVTVTCVSRYRYWFRVTGWSRGKIMGLNVSLTTLLPALILL